VGSPIGAILGIIIIAALIGFGVFYYVKCLGQRKTNPQEGSAAKDIDLEAGRRGYGSVSPTSQTDATELTDTPVHVYVQT